MESILGLLAIFLIYIVGGIIIFKVASAVASAIYSFFRKHFVNQKIE